MSIAAAFDRAIAAWNAGDLDAYLRLSTADAVLHGAGGTLDRAGAEAAYRALHAAHPGVQLTVTAPAP